MVERLSFSFGLLNSTDENIRIAWILLKASPTIKTPLEATSIQLVPTQSYNGILLHFKVLLDIKDCETREKAAVLLAEMGATLLSSPQEDPDFIISDYIPASDAGDYLRVSCQWVFASLEQREPLDLLPYMFTSQV